MKKSRHSVMPQAGSPKFKPASPTSSRVTLETLREELGRLNNALCAEFNDVVGRLMNEAPVGKGDRIAIKRPFMLAVPEASLHLRESSEEAGGISMPLRETSEESAQQQELQEHKSELRNVAAATTSLPPSSVNHVSSSECSKTWLLPPESPLGQVEDCTAPLWGPCAASPLRPCRDLQPRMSRMSYRFRSPAHHSDDAFDILNAEHLASSSSEEEEEHVQESPQLSDASSLSEVVAALVRHPYFNVLVSILIGMNSLMIGLEVDYAAKHLDLRSPVCFAIIDFSFCAFFVLELSLRICVHRCRFLSMPGWRWNAFDCTVTLLQVVDTLPIVLSWWKVELSLSFQVFFRFCRVVRIVRAARLLSSVKDLRVLVAAFAGSFKTLLWVLLLLFLTLYAFSVLLTTLVTEHMQGRRHSAMEPDSLKMLNGMFGSLLATMLTLYQAISGGIDWRDATEPFAKNISTFLPTAFALYMAIMVFALLNVVTGVVLNSAMQAAENDRRHAIADQLRQFFREHAAEKSSSLDPREFELHLRDHSIHHALHSLGITLDDARHLLHILQDSSASHKIAVEDFVAACLRWGAPAKKIDYALMQREIHNMSTDIQDEMKVVNEMSIDMKAEMKLINALSAGLQAEMQSVNALLDELHAA